MRRTLPWGVALTLWGCGDEPPPPRPSPVQEAATVPPRPAPRPSHIKQKLDDLGRLRVAADRIYGFQVPVGMTLVSERKGSQVYDYVAPVDRLVEFWMHRDYSVTKEARGWSVHHTPTTLLGAQSGLYDKARILILAEGTNRAKLRFSVPLGPENRLNPLNAEVPTPVEGVARGLAPLPVAPDAPARLPVGRTSGAPVRPEAPPAPWEPQPELLRQTGQGRADASEVVREWMRRNPGRTFQD